MVLKKPTDINHEYLDKAELKTLVSKDEGMEGYIHPLKG